MAQKVRTGDIDFVINATANAATIVPQCGVFSLHFVFRDENHLAKSTLDPGVNALFIEMIAKNTTGARSLGLMTLGFRKFYSKNEIHSVADVKGRKVRVQATATEDRFFSAYGAIPVHMPIGQVYTSLETGLVDIAENGADIYRAQKHYEVAPVLSGSTTRPTTTTSGSATRHGTASTIRSRAGVTQSFAYARGLEVPEGA